MIETFFITGVSGGLGLAFAKEALTAGHRVVGTVRNPDQATTFTELDPWPRLRPATRRHR